MSLTSIQDLDRLVEEVAKRRVNQEEDYAFVVGQFERAWDLLSPSEQRSLALAGWRALVDDERHKFRKSSWYRTELKRLHDESRCQVGYSIGHYNLCVGHLVMLPEEEQQAGLEVLKKQADRLREWHDDVLERMYLRQVNLIGADGRAKTLDKFTRDDVEMWEARATGQAKAWMLRSKWFTETREALDQEKVNRVADLSKETLGRIDRRAEDVWGDDKEETP